MSFVTTRQAAVRLGCTKQNVADLIHRGRLAAKRHGPRGWFIVTRESLDAYVAQRKVAPASLPPVTPVVSPSVSA